MNSMFRWYQRATKCYVYLADVSVGEQQVAMDFTFRWYQRATECYAYLAGVSTGISIEALQGKRLSSFSKQERFSWMERRTTKYEEDKVYALLGIFEVELVIQYGQGWASAMEKLEEAISVQTDVMRDLRVTHPWEVMVIMVSTLTGVLSRSW
ncbi:uncharacterized protein K489DRAFT_435672 [Dissoconium aciculare CBS 342.82]|uniref:Uncharacterized protein n=1 Tax=Dissoconium aciculare CBS 342.82 TaxID=1314786 RepID=A0A6J3LPC7_9PEZI|nr:uncharacterized protein K489DRAFT_435672 [Dissoconium aciculare CBS 342.82]KAF1817740.1 hypothetical protein K489DRAFT_435672 [Dissoconium aciculare CBS 342.82]